MFTQFTLNQSINQTRGIFDTYSYRTEDSIDEVTTAGYFAHSRFIPDADGSFDWRGAIIDCECADGLFTVRILQDGDSAELAPGSFEVTVDGGTYTVTGGENRIWALNSPTITFPRANTVAFPNIPIRTLSGTTTLAAITSTIEVTSIPNGSSVVIGQRVATDEWLQII